MQLSIIFLIRICIFPSQGVVISRELMCDDARIVTGATKLVSLNSLYKEIGWDKLEKRREYHKLIQFFKMIKGLTPEYLSDLIPHQHDHVHQYNTRNANNIINIRCKTNHFYHSFIPSTIRLWNLLPDRVKYCNNVRMFKTALSNIYGPKNIPKYYNIGSRKGQILHARLRMNCSSLKHHLFIKNIEVNSVCECGEIETTSTVKKSQSPVDGDRGPVIYIFA